MTTNEKSYENLYAQQLGIITEKKVESSESLSDRDFDAMAAEIQSLESTVDFAMAYESIQEYNSAQMIRMINRLKKVTKGDTKYHESVENYLDYQLSMEADAATAPEAAKAADKPNTQGGGQQAEKWYIRLWNFIKKIFDKIVNFVRERVNQFRQWFNSKFAKTEELRALRESDPTEFKSLVDELGKASFEKQSDSGLIPLGNNVGAKLASSVAGFVTLSNKFAAICNEINNRKGITAEVQDHLNQVANAIGAYVGINMPKLNGSDKEAIKQFNTNVKQSANGFDYDKDPAKFIAKFTGSQVMQGVYAGGIIKVTGQTDPEKIIQVCLEVNNNLAKSSNELTKSKNEIEKAHGVAMSYFKSIGVTSENGDIQQRTANEKNGETATGVEILQQSAGTITALFNCLTKIAGVIQKLVTQILSESEQCGTIINKHFKKHLKKHLDNAKKEKKLRNENNSLIK